MTIHDPEYVINRRNQAINDVRIARTSLDNLINRLIHEQIDLRTQCEIITDDENTPTDVLQHFALIHERLNTSHSLIVAARVELNLLLLDLE